MPEAVDNATTARQRLREVASAALSRFSVPGSPLVADRLVQAGHGWQRGQSSLSATCHVLVGVSFARARGASLPIDDAGTLEHVVPTAVTEGDWRHLALLLWADAHGAGRHQDVLIPALKARLPARASKAMEMGWALASTATSSMRAPRTASLCLAVRLAARLLRLQASSGLFHASSDGMGWLRRRASTTSLWAQLYPVLGLALLAQATGDASFARAAAQAADALCRAQGPRGQWWASYDADTGAPDRAATLFAVNQDGAAPMALGELTRATGESRYWAAATRGLSWVLGDNELGVPLVDTSAGLLWTGIEFAGGTPRLVTGEFRAYHPARCLYGVAVLEETEPLAEGARPTPGRLSST